MTKSSFIRRLLAPLAVFALVVGTAPERLVMMKFDPGAAEARFGGGGGRGGGARGGGGRSFGGGGRAGGRSFSGGGRHSRGGSYVGRSSRDFGGSKVRTRPSTRPANVRPNRPDTRPNTRPNRPEGGNRPNRPNRPEGGNRPNRPNAPGAGNRPNRPNGPGAGNRPNRPDVGNRPGRPGRPGVRPPGYRPPHYRPPHWRPPTWRPPYYRPPYYRPPHWHYGDYYYNPGWGWYLTGIVAGATLVYVATLPDDDDGCEEVLYEGETLYECDGVLYRSTVYDNDRVYEIVSSDEETKQANAGGDASRGPLMLTSPAMRGPEVAAVQQALSERGYNVGAIDGIFGSGTDRAVRAFQSDNGLPVTGVVDSDTAASLGV